MIQQFDHRFSNARPPQKAGGIRGRADHLGPVEKADPNQLAETRYYVPAKEVHNRMKGYKWCIGYREIAGAVANIRSMSAAILPEVGVNNKILLVAVKAKESRRFSPCLLANLNCFAFDYVLRQKMTGTSLSFYIVRQIPTMPQRRYLNPCEFTRESVGHWVTLRVLELTCMSSKVLGPQGLFS